MERTPEERLEDALDEIARRNAPERSRSREEIEQDYGDLETKLHEEQEPHLKLTLAGYERRELDIRTREATAPLYEAMKSQDPFQQLSTGEVIKWKRAQAAEQLEADVTFQADKDQLTQDLADRYEAMLNRHYDHREALLVANGFEMAREQPNEGPTALTHQLKALIAVEPQSNQDGRIATEQDYSQPNEEPQKKVAQAMTSLAAFQQLKKQNPEAAKQLSEQLAQSQVQDKEKQKER